MRTYPTTEDMVTKAKQPPKPPRSTSKPRMGRPPKPPEERARPKSFSLEPDVLEAVDDTQPEDMTRSKYVSQLLREALEARRKARARKSAH